ncbi:MAG: hypothetical protein ABJM58_11650 [Alteripontixanthobacter sp.]
MSIGSVTSGLSRSALIEAIYRASKIVTERQYDFDNSRSNYLTKKEQVRVAGVVAGIIKEIEDASNVNISALPPREREKVLKNLYDYLEQHISTGRASSLKSDELLADLYSTP